MCAFTRIWFLLFSQYISGDGRGARCVGAEAGDELRLRA